MAASYDPTYPDDVATFGDPRFPQRVALGNPLAALFGGGPQLAYSLATAPLPASVASNPPLPPSRPAAVTTPTNDDPANRSLPTTAQRREYAARVNDGLSWLRPGAGNDTQAPPSGALANAPLPPPRPADPGIEDPSIEARLRAAALAAQKVPANAQAAAPSLSLPVTTPANVQPAPSPASVAPVAVSALASPPSLAAVTAPPAPQGGPLAALPTSPLPSPYVTAQAAPRPAMTPSGIALSGGADNTKLANAAMIPTTGLIPTQSGYGRDQVVGGYGQDPEVPAWAKDDTPDWARRAPEGNASNWGPTTEILNGAMLGMLPTAEGWLGNHVPSWLGGGSIPSAGQIQADRDAYATQHPVISSIATATGGALPYLAAGEAAAPFGLLSRMGAMAGTGAAASALPSIVRGDDAGTVAGNALGGAALGAAGEGVGSALAGAGGKLASALLNRGVKVPTASDLKTAADAGYDAMRSGNSALFSPDSVANMANDAIDALGNQGMHSGGQGTLQILRRLANPGSNAIGVPTGGLEEARQSLNQLIRDNSGTTEARAASFAKDKLDAFAASSPPGSVVEGDVQPYLDQLRDARGNWAAYKRSGTLTGALDRAEGAAEAGSGDLASKLALRANTILNSPRLHQGLSADDLQGLKDIRAGTPTMNAARTISKWTGGGHGSGFWGPMMAGIEGMREFGPWGALAAAAPPLVHAISSRVGATAARGAMNTVDEQTRMASPLFEQWVRSGQSAAPVDVQPGVAIARKLSSALLNSGGRVAEPYLVPSLGQ
jgi:hypothetical protein